MRCTFRCFKTSNEENHNNMNKAGNYVCISLPYLIQQFNYLKCLILHRPKKQNSKKNVLVKLYLKGIKSEFTFMSVISMQIV